LQRDVPTRMLGVLGAVDGLNSIEHDRELRPFGGGVVTVPFVAGLGHRRDLGHIDDGPRAVARVGDPSLASLRYTRHRPPPLAQQNEGTIESQIVELSARSLDCVKAEALVQVAHFWDFTADNDPHGEHDFGSFTLVGRKFFWKIDHYDKRCEFGSEDPSDPEKTTRVLTLMLAEEY
jgi:Protein of unknown function (DUF3768)